MDLLERLEESIHLYFELISHIIDIGYLIQAIDISQLSKELLNYGIELCKQGALYESIYEYKLAKQKYMNALFIIDELYGEFHQALKFSEAEGFSS